MVSSSKDGILLHIWRRSRIALSLDGLVIWIVNSDIAICSLYLTFSGVVLDGTAIRLFLEPTMAIVFMSFSRLKWLQLYSRQFKLVLYGRYVDDIFVLFKSAGNLLKCHAYLNTCHRDMTVLFEEEKDGKLYM